MEMKSLLLTEKVKRLLSKKDKEKLGMVEEESDLIDNCKYIVYTSNEYLFEDGGNSLPCRSLKECADYIRNKVYLKEEL